MEIPVSITVVLPFNYLNDTYFKVHHGILRLTFVMDITIKNKAGSQLLQAFSMTETDFNHRCGRVSI